MKFKFEEMNHPGINLAITLCRIFSVSLMIF